MPFDSTEIAYDIEREFMYVLICPICGEIMMPIPGGFECVECGHVEYKMMWILKLKGKRVLVR